MWICYFIHYMLIHVHHASTKTSKVKDEYIHFMLIHVHHASTKIRGGGHILTNICGHVHHTCYLFFIRTLVLVSELIEFLKWNHWVSDIKSLSFWHETYLVSEKQNKIRGHTKENLGACQKLAESCPIIIKDRRILYKIEVKD